MEKIQSKMETSIVKKLMVFMMSILVFTACSSDDEPAKALEGEELVNHMENVLTCQMENMYANETFDLYLLPVKSETEAREVVGQIILEDWDGNDKTFQVPVNFGHIRMMKGAEEGVYYTLVFDVTGLKHFTFQLCTPGYPESDNIPESTGHVAMTLGYMWCNNCRQKTYIEHCVCAKCGSSNVVWKGGGSFR